MLYLDTSSLLKLLLPEPESLAVQRAIFAESNVVVSALTELEAEVQLRGGWLGGTFTRSQYRRLVARLRDFAKEEPFQFRSLPGTLFRTALEQHRAAGRHHLRTLDRLHLAAMQELGLRRLMTHDLILGRAARDMGCEVMTPI